MDKKTNRKSVVLFGSSGKMGQEVVQVLAGEKTLQLVTKFDKGTDADVKQFKNLLDHYDVAIDFSGPALFADVIGWCVKNKVALVSGTTGLSEANKKSLAEAAKSIPILWEPNMSLGVAVMKTLIKGLQPLSDTFDFQIEEVHHRHKKDKPSGTAIALQEKLKEVVKKKIEEPLSIRGGGVYGIHKVFAMSESEVLTIEHSALNRKVFAEGAVAAAKWLTQKKKGQYHLTDVLGL